MSTLSYATLAHAGAEYEAIPARIARTDLGYQDHGIFTIGLYFEWGSGSQGMPGWSFGRGDAEDKVGAFVRRVLAVVGVSRWEAVAGSSVYVLRAGGVIRGLASVDDDGQRVFIAADLFVEDRAP